MMGHKLNDIDAAYSHPTVKALRDAYKKATPYLEIYKEIPTDRVGSLEREIQEAGERIEALETSLRSSLNERDKLSKEISELKGRMERVERVRGRADDIMDELFEDPEVVQLVSPKLIRVECAYCGHRWSILLSGVVMKNALARGLQESNCPKCGCDIALVVELGEAKVEASAWQTSNVQTETKPLSG